MIDAGISAVAIAPDLAAEGQNYILPGQSTEDLLGHGTAVAAFSQQNDSVDILAPGTDLRLATPKGTRIRGRGGTSYAAAQVTGVAAELWNRNPQLTAAEVRNILISTAQVVDGIPVLDAEAALADSPGKDASKD